MTNHPEDVYTPKTDTKTFNVEVGNVPKEEVEGYVEKIKKKLKEKPILGIDPNEELRKQIEESEALERKELEKAKKLKNS